MRTLFFALILSVAMMGCGKEKCGTCYTINASARPVPGYPHTFTNEQCGDDLERWDGEVTHGYVIDGGDTVATTETTTCD